ncbi:MAG: TVP38/TMEM64 family protein [Parcubacteria group bacterium]|nr:TVP38/TMEM64 family protein [Parcubacteria group bacterium]
MAKLNKIKLWQIGKVLIVIIAFSLLLKWLLPVVSSDKFIAITESMGIFGPLVVILYVVVSHIVAPLAGLPGVLLGASIYGIVKTVLFLYIAGLISGTINFWISRRFGRKWVAKLAGEKTINQIDNFVLVSGKKVLIASRLFGFALFEVISYAAGFTNMRFKTYFIITVIFSAVPAVVFGYAFKSVDFLSVTGQVLWMGTIIIVGAVFAFMIKRYMRRG